MRTMSSRHPCLEPPPRLKRVERPEQIPPRPRTIAGLIRAIVRRF
jgi:hypothetical protein